MDHPISPTTLRRIHYDAFIADIQKVLGIHASYTISGDLSTILPVYAYYAVRRDIEEYVDAHQDEYFKE